MTGSTRGKRIATSVLVRLLERLPAERAATALAAIERACASAERKLAYGRQAA